METNKTMQMCDEHVAMTAALSERTSVHLAPVGGQVQGTSAFSAGRVSGSMVRPRSVDSIRIVVVGGADLGVKRDVPTYNSTFAGGVRRSVLHQRPPV